ncbi:MAG: 2-hydroxyacid dehydrogenase [Marmoricola sp.]
MTTPKATPAAPVLAAGDRFITPALLAEKLRIACRTPLDIKSLTLPWPDVPFGPVAEVHEASGTEDEMVDALAGVRICVTQMAPLTEKVLSSRTELDLCCVTRGGPVNVDLDAATRHGVAVCSAPGRNASATAEHTVAIMLAAMRRIPQVHGDLEAGTWRGDYYRYDSVGLELGGRTVGLLGCGAVGTRVARIVAAFGAHVLVYDPYVVDDAVRELADLVSLDELFARSDVISLHARATDETRGVVSASRIEAMPSGGVLVNCARGSLVDYTAVCDALDSGHLFAAAFDVFPTEPIPADSRLRRTHGVVMTPHLAGASRETAHNAGSIAAAEVARYLEGAPLQHCLNPEVLQGGTSGVSGMTDEY